MPFDVMVSMRGPWSPAASCSGRHAHYGSNNFSRTGCWSESRPSRRTRGINSVTTDRQTGAGVVRESREKIDKRPPRGTRDFFPEDLRLQKWLFDKFSSVSEAFGFEQIDNPVLESEELFVRKAGEEITQQLYNFKDKGGRSVALRPELTPSLARMIIQKGKSLALPLKWYAIGQCWRYERMTKGRRREHYQWNMDIVGIDGQEAEAELLGAITLFFEQVGLTPEDVVIKINSRKVIQEVLERYDVPPESIGPVCVVVDKMDKLPEGEIVQQLVKLGISLDKVEDILSVLQSTTIQELEGLLGCDSNAVNELKNLFSLAEGYGYSNWLALDASIVRGLAYYTGIVFEAADREGKLRAICGGGRYDKLLGTFGEENQGCAGFGFGDAVILELLKDKGLLPEFPRQVDDLMLVLDAPLRCKANGIAQSLRRSGRSVDIVLEEKKMKWAFKYAEKIGARRLIIVGNQEWEKGLIRIKDLLLHQESDVPISEFISVP